MGRKSSVQQNMTELAPLVQLAQRAHARDNTMAV